MRLFTNVSPIAVYRLLAGYGLTDNYSQISWIYENLISPIGNGIFLCCFILRMVIDGRRIVINFHCAAQQSAMLPLPQFVKKSGEPAKRAKKKDNREGSHVLA